MTGLRVGIVAAEPSGDILAAGLMRELQVQHPGIQFEGIGGPNMQAEGLQSRVPMEKLSVMGLVEVLRHLPELLRIRKNLAHYWIQNPPDLFIGIDAPDFNLGLEKKLKSRGIPTVHYVCPTIWAWRAGRVKTIKAAADLVLCLFPFEPDLLEKHGIAAKFIGHPLAEEYPINVDRQAAREQLKIPDGVPVLAVLPGSRVSEVERLSSVFINAALRCRESLTDLQVVTPLTNETTRSIFKKNLEAIAPELPVSIVQGDSKLALSAADVGLIASGTATLEGMLCKCPMVVGYRANSLSYKIVTGLNLIKTPYVAMANILLGEMVAPEFIQQDCTEENLGNALMEWFSSPDKMSEVRHRYQGKHQEMVMDSNRQAALAVADLLPGNSSSSSHSEQH